MDRLPGPWTRHVVTTSLGFARRGLGARKGAGASEKVNCLAITSFDFGLRL